MERTDAIRELMEEKELGAAADSNGSAASGKENGFHKVIAKYRKDPGTGEALNSELKPTMVIKGFRVRPGYYDQPGATVIPGGVNFTLHSHQATEAQLVLYHRKQARPFAVLPFPRTFRIGDTWSMIVFGLDIEDFEYCFRLDGPYDPSKGILFNREDDLLDPYARAVVGQSYWGYSEKHKGFYRARVVHNQYDWGSSTFPNTPMEDSIIYEMHVRGFTKDDSSGVKYPGTFAGVVEKIPYFKKLGITAVELMPIMEFDETINSRGFGNSMLYEYWGYNTVAFFAPNTSYAASHEFNYEGTELKNMVRALHENGIEVIMDVVFNHTAEGNEYGPTISFKGFDNNIFYMLTPDAKYYNFSGCGNTVNCNHPLVRDFIVSCLRYWVTEYHIDGFRFDLASILGRNQDGTPMENPPLIELLANDPIVGKTKLIAEAWDAGGLYQVGSFPNYGRWAEWNGSYRDCLRDYLKGNYWNAPEVANRILGSSDLYHGVSKGYTSSVNFLTCHDGFTLRDLYSYNTKHNELNGWNNTDGSDDNRSWNCGVEGDTDNPDILRLRGRLMRNAIAVLMVSRGTPMILSGDEFCNTQYGNNNTYCQDNEIAWLNWTDLKTNRGFFDFTRRMIRFRRDHSCIRKDLYGQFGSLPRSSAWDARPGHGSLTGDTSLMAVLFSGQARGKKKAEDSVLMIINTYWEKQRAVLPELPKGYIWKLQVNTDDPEEEYWYKEPIPYRTSREVDIDPRTVFIFVAAREKI